MLWTITMEHSSHESTTQQPLERVASVCVSNITTYSLFVVLPMAVSDSKKCGCPRDDLTAILKGIWWGIYTTVNTSTSLPSHL